MWKQLSRNIYISAACVLLVLTTNSGVGNVSAAQLLSRNVIVGSSLPSANTNHTFNFTLSSVSSVGSIEFLYCSNSAVVGTPCTAPTGLDVSSAVISSQSGEIGFSVDPLSTTNRILISRAPGLVSAVPVSYRFSNVVNQSTDNSTSYVRITTYPTIDGSGSYTDDGSVAFSTTTNFTVAGYVPPYLIFCVGVTVAANCSSASGQQLSFGELSSSESKAVTSQFSGATNDPGGYSVSIKGLTLTSGNNIIQPLNAPSTSQVGSSQFGMNLRANSSPSIGLDPSGVGTATPAVNYNQPNLFAFNNNQVVASSPLPTDFNVLTATYIVNVSPNQKAGIYTTTLTYIGTAAF